MNFENLETHVGTFKKITCKFEIHAQLQKASI